MVANCPDSDDSSMSLTESVKDYPIEFGRRYHAYRAGSVTAYAFPNDNYELERLTFQYDILTALFSGRLFFAPLTKASPPRRILDIGTGTGKWAIQMGDYFPETEIIATDLSPVQPEEVPPNVNFFVEDSSEPWDYTQPFDYIHTRVTAGCWSCFKTQVAQQAFDSLSPGGWLESQEFDSYVACDDGTVPENSHLSAYLRTLAEAAAQMDRPMKLACHLRSIYEEVGFVDVHERIFKIPTNGWPRDERLKELGKNWELNLRQGLSGFSYNLYHRAFGRTAVETELSLVDVRREISDPRMHAYMPIYVVWGRKPFPGEPVPNRTTS
ncbi:TAM domain methyltransferase [Geosmithia morbida]|uniref:TAM domain methyltransferase n=1 Tax=Geosmithia morbida TaxID=1094350 RepID=A0A9P5D6M8_9HYPO|nr:TAM domain methyltransferase [Geosmithia morbida]KAF4125761.1 TAM domain methyltransferase [Geosmithia morbida]